MSYKTIFSSRCIDYIWSAQICQVGFVSFASISHETLDRLVSDIKPLS